MTEQTITVDFAIQLEDRALAEKLQTIDPKDKNALDKAHQNYREAKQAIQIMYG